MYLFCIFQFWWWRRDPKLRIHSHLDPLIKWHLYLANMFLPQRVSSAPKIIIHDQHKKITRELTLADSIHTWKWLLLQIWRRCLCLKITKQLGTHCTLCLNIEKKPNLFTHLLSFLHYHGTFILLLCDSIV